MGVFGCLTSRGDTLAMLGRPAWSGMKHAVATTQTLQHSIKQFLIGSNFVNRNIRVEQVIWPQSL